MSISPLGMLSETAIEVDVAQMILAVGALCAALGIPAILAAKRSRRAVSTAQAVADEFRPTITEVSAVAEQVRPENGTRLGESVENISRLLEAVDGRLHDVSKRVDAQGRELGEIRRHAAGIESQLISQGEVVEAVGQQVQVVDAKIQTHIEEYRAGQVDKA